MGAREGAVDGRRPVRLIPGDRPDIDDKVLWRETGEIGYVAYVFTQHPFKNDVIVVFERGKELVQVDELERVE